MSTAVHTGGSLLGVAERLSAWLGRRGTVAVEARDGVFDATSDDLAHDEAAREEARRRAERPAQSLAAQRRVARPRASRPMPTYTAGGRVELHGPQQRGGLLDITA